MNFNNTIQTVSSVTQRAAQAAMEPSLQPMLMPRMEVTVMDFDSPGAFFSAHFNNISQEVTADPAWVSDAGLFDGALQDPILRLMLPPGHMLRCVDEHARKAIFIGTYWGPAVVFQRYSDDAQSLLAQLPTKVEKYGMKFYSYLSIEELQMLLGDSDTPNFGNQ